MYSEEEKRRRRMAETGVCLGEANTTDTLSDEYITAAIWDEEVPALMDD